MDDDEPVESGLLLEVRWEWSGTEFSEDHAVGTSVLNVVDPETFTEDESLWVMGVFGPHIVQNVDADAGTITVDPPLTVAAELGDAVVPDYGDGPQRIWVAEVVFADPDSPVEIPLKAADLLVIPEGRYEPPINIIVKGDYESIVDIPGQFPRVSYELLDPSTKPPDPLPEPPVSPLPITTGVFAAVKVTWEYKAGTHYRLYAHPPTEDGNPPPVQPDSTMLVDDDAQHQWVDKYADETPLDAVQPSWFAIWAYNEAGDAAIPSIWVSGAPIELGSDFVDRLVTASLIARQIEGETISGITLSGVTLDIVGALHAEPNLLNMLAQTIEVTGRATFYDNVDIRGANNLLRGVLTAGAGVPNPKSAPDVWPSWPNTYVGFESGSEANDRWAGLVTNPAEDEWVSATWLRYDRYGIIQRRTLAGTFVSNTVLGPWHPGGGITRIGSTYYVLGNPTHGTPTWQIRRFSATTLAEIGSAVDTGIVPAATPAIGTDGTDILVSFSHSTIPNAVRIQHRNASTLAYIKQADCVHNLSRNFDVGFVGGGMWDTGVERYMVAPVSRGVGDGKVMAFTTGGVKSVSYEFPAAGNTWIYGMWWDGTRFWHLDGNGRVWEYGRNLTSVPAASYAYRRSSDDVQTAASPQSSTIIAPRAYVTIATPPPPGTGEPADPDSVAVYVVNKLAGVITAPTSGRWQLTLDTLPASGAAPKTNGFSVGAIGEWRSTALHTDGLPLTRLRGDGNDRIYGAMVRQNITLSNGYTVGSIQPRYRIDPVGRVELTGSINVGTAANGDIAFILPPGFRPTSDFISMITGLPYGNGNTATRIDIRTNGEVRFYKGASAVTGWDLSNISFSTVP